MHLQFDRFVLYSQVNNSGIAYFKHFLSKKKNPFITHVSVKRFIFSRHFTTSGSNNKRSGLLDFNNSK